MVEVYRAASVRVRLSDLPHDVRESIVKTFSIYERCYTHLFWCARLGIEPDPNVVKLARSLPWNFYCSLLDSRSPLYQFRHVPSNVKKSLVRNVVKTTCQVIWNVTQRRRYRAVTVDLVNNVVEVRGFSRIIRIPLSRSFRRWILDVLRSSNFEASFHAQLILERRLNGDPHYLRITVVASRRVDLSKLRIDLPLRSGRWTILAMDVNSTRGVKCLYALLDLDRGVCKLLQDPRFRPPGHAYRRAYASKLRSLLKRLQNTCTITVSKMKLYRFLYRMTLRRISRLNRQWCRDTVHIVVKRLLRYCRKHRARPLVLLDVPDYETLHGDPRLQGTLLRFVKHLENRLLWYEVPTMRIVAYSRRCPLCGEPMEKLYETRNVRAYICKRCRIVLDRDYVACLNAVRQVLPEDMVLKILQSLIRVRCLSPQTMRVLPESGGTPHPGD